MLHPCVPASVVILILPQPPIEPAAMRVVNKTRQQGIADAHRAHHANRQMNPADLACGLMP